MREIRLSGSVEGVMGNHDSYSDSGLRFSATAGYRGTGNQYVGSEPDTQPVTGANRDGGETIQKALQDLGGSLPESLPGPGPETCRASPIRIAALQGQAGDRPDGSDGRKQGEVMPVHPVLQCPFADLIESMKVEGNPTAVGKQQAVEADHQPGLILRYDFRSRADRSRSPGHQDLAAGRRSKTARTPPPGPGRESLRKAESPAPPPGTSPHGFAPSRAGLRVRRSELDSRSPFSAQQLLLPRSLRAESTLLHGSAEIAGLGPFARLPGR